MRRLGERGVLAPDCRVALDRGQRDQRPNRQAVSFSPDGVEAADRLQVDETVGLDDPRLHFGQQVDPARDRLRLRRVGTEHLRRLAQVARTGVLERLHAFHAAPPLCWPSAVNTLSGVIGASGIRTPMALNTAFPIADATGMTHGSPMPLTRPVFVGKIFTTTSGISLECVSL